VDVLCLLLGPNANGSDPPARRPHLVHYKLDWVKIMRAGERPRAVKVRRESLIVSDLCEGVQDDWVQIEV